MDRKTADLARDHEFGVHLRDDFEANPPVNDSKVGLIMGSRSDWPYVIPAAWMLNSLKIPFEYGVVSAHRTPKRMHTYTSTAHLRGLRVIIACAGGSAHLPGMVASETLLPVLGVAPKKSDTDAVGSMIAMPSGKPLAYMGGGSDKFKNAGAVNAALQAARILALSDPLLSERLHDYDSNLGADVPFTCSD